MGNFIAHLIEFVARIWHTDSEMRDRSAMTAGSQFDRDSRRFVAWLCCGIIVLLLISSLLWGWRPFHRTTIYNIEVCEIHRTKMEHEEVRIAYGLIRPGPDEPSGDTERRLFSHRRGYSLGGCVITPFSPKTMRVYVCTDCKKAYQKWMTDNKKTK